MITGLKRCVIAACIVVLSGCTTNVENQSTPSAYDTAFDYLKQGKQDKAEEILASAVEQDVKNQRLVFFMAVCARSRWMKRNALPIFNYVAKLNPDTPEGKCSAIMLAIDCQKEYKDNFAALETLYQKNPHDPLILWMTAVACRELGRRGAPRIYSEKGATYYAMLLKTMTPGPVLLYQTYANILSEELGKHEEALKYREMAVRLEPAPWSYQGMASTLTYLKRYEEADINYKKCIELAPDRASYLSSWAWSMGQRNKYDKAFDLYKRVAEIAPNHSESWRNLGWCAKKLNRFDESRKYYDKAKSLEQKSK